MNLNFRDQLIFHMEFQIDIGHSVKNWHYYLKEDIDLGNTPQKLIENIAT